MHMDGALGEMLVTRAIILLHHLQGEADGCTERLYLLAGGGAVASLFTLSGPVELSCRRKNVLASGGEGDFP